MNHNKDYELNLESFMCAINRFSDLTKKEFQQKFTGFHSPDDYNVTHEQGFGIKGFGTGIVVANHKKIIQEAKVLKSIDWRRTAVSSVKKQGECGSCWTFSAAGSLEGQIYIKARRFYDVSAQTDGCTGGLMTDAFKFSMSNGIVEDSKYPYIDKESPNGCTKPDSIIPIKVTGYIELKKLSEDELQRAVSTIGPISVAIDARWQSLQFYETGVYFEPNCDSHELNHAVLVVGYGTDANFGDYWIIKNSWGTGWGEYGYIRMARNKSNHCGVATMPSYPVVSVKL
ncbi:procathepsin L-like [Chironomus tepperi]|uniref:procathepsin L-like n=1 Tax=Chironomus tepperi TaxID=113505 RepID=UPI00391EE85F